MKKGFTLVELLAVVIVVGILMGIGMPQYRKVVDKARVAEAESMLGIIYDSSERLAGDFGYPSFQQLQADKSNIRITRLDMFDADHLPAKCNIEGDTASTEILKCSRFWYKVNVKSGSKYYVVAKYIKGKNEGTYVMLNRADKTLACQPASGKTNDFCEMLGLDVVKAGFTF